MAVTAAELLVLVRAEGVEATAASLLGLGEATSAAALGFTALAIAGAATVGGLVAATAEAANFQRSTMEIANNTTMATGQIDTMRQTILALGADSGVSFDILGQGFMKAMNITNDTAASMAILTVATESAASTGGNAAATTNVLANAMHEYGLDVVRAADGTNNLAAVQANAAHVMGVMHLAAASGNMTLEDYSNYSGRAIGIAANLGVSLEDVSAGFSSLTRHGFDAATAGTQMTNILTHLINPTKSAHSELVKLSNATGVDLVADFSAAGLSSKGLEGVLGDLKTAYEKMGYSSAQAEAESMKLIAAQRGGLGLATLLGTGYEDFRKTLADLNNQELTNSITEESYNKIKETAGFQWDRLKRTVQEAAIVLGTSMLPALTGVLSGLQAAVAGALPFINTYGPMLAAAIGTGLTAILNFAGQVRTAIAAVLGAFQSLLSGQTNLSQFIGGMEAWIGTILGKLGELAARAAPYIGQFFSAIGSAINTYGPQIEAQFAIWGDRLSSWIQTTAIPFLLPRLAAFLGTINGWVYGTLIPGLVSFWGGLGLALVGWIGSTAIPFLLTNLPLWLDAFDGWLRGTAVPRITAFVAPLAAALSNWITTTAIPAVLAQLSAWGTAINAWLNGTFAPAVAAALAAAWAAISAATGGAFSALGTLVRDKLTEIKNAVGETFSGLGSAIRDKLTDAKNAVGDAFSGMGTAIRDALTGVKNSVGDAFNGLGTTIRDALTDAKNAVGDTFNGIGTTIRDALTSVKNAVGDAFSGLGTTIRDALTSVKNAVGDTFNGLGTTVQDALTAVKNAVGDTFSGLGSGIQGALDSFRSTVMATWNAIPEDIRANLAIVISDIGEKFSAMGTAVEAAMTTILATITSTWAAVVGAVGAALSALGSAVSGAMSAIGETVGAAFSALGSTVSGAMSAIGEAVGTTFSALGSAVSGAMSAIQGAIESGWAAITAAVGSAMSAVGSAVDTGWTAITAAVGAAMSAIGSAVDAGWTAITSAVGAAMSAVGSAVDTGWTAITSAVGSAMSAVGSAVDAGWSAITSTVTSAVAAIYGAVTSAWASVVSATQAAWSGFLATITGFLAQAIGAVQGFGGQVASALASVAGAAAGEAAAIGGAIVQGLVGGIQAGASAIAGAAADVVRGALSAARNALESKSPSRKFMELGNDAVAGLVIGITAMAGTAADAATGMAAGVNDAVVNFFEIASPSKKTHAHGRAVAQGLTNGIASATPAAAKAAADLAVSVAKGITDTLAAMHLLSTYDFATGSPSGGQFAMLGTLTAQMVATIQDAAKGFGDAGLKAATAFADAAAKVGTMVKSALTGLADLAAFDFAKNTPTAQQMGMLTTLTVSLVQTIQDAAAQFNDLGLKSATTFAEAAGKVGGMVKNALAGLSELANFDFAKNTPTGQQMGMLTTLVVSLVQTIEEASVAFSGQGLKSATLFAESAGKVGGMVKNALAALSELASFDFAKNTPTGSAMGLFRQMITDVVLNIVQAATAFTDQGIKAAAAFAESATKVMGLITAGVAAFDKLATFVAPPAAAIYAFGKALRAALNDLALVAEQVTQDAAASAAKFAESAGKVVGMLGTGVGAFAKLTTFQAVPLAAVYAFGKALRATINDFALLAEQITPDATRAAALFAEGAGKVVGMLGAGVAAFEKLADFAAPASSAIYAFGKTLRAVIDDLALVAEQVTQQATDSAAKFASGATTVLGVFGNGIAGLMDLAKFVAPSQKAIDDFAYAVGHLVERFANAARMIGEQGVVEAGKFGTAAKLAVDTIKVGLETFTLFKKMVVPSAEAIDTLVAGVTYVVGRFRDMANAMGHDALTKAQAFGTAVEHTAKSIQAAIGTFKSLTEPPFKGALTKIMTEFNGDFDQSLAMMIEAHGKAAQFETEARMYKEAMLNAATSIAAGNAALANAALPGNSLGRDMKAAGQNLGNALHDAVRDTLQIKSPSQVMVAVGQQVVAGLVGGMSSTQQAAVAKAAALAKAVADAVIVTLTSLRALGNLNSAALPSGDQVGAFLASTMQVVNAVAAAASAMNGKALDAAVKFAEGAGKVLGFVGSAVTALTGLAALTPPAASAIYAFDKTLRLLVNDFALTAEQVGTEMLGLATTFSTGAGAVADAVGKGVAGLTKLASYVDPAPAAIYALGKTLRLAIQDFAALAALVGKDMLAEATSLAAGAGKVADTVGKGVAGLGKLVDYVAPPAAAVYALGKTLRLLVADFAALADLLGNDAIASAGRFADSAGKVVGIIGNAVDGFTKLAAYKGIDNTLIGPFVETVRTLITAIGQVAAQFTTEGLTLAGRFADTAAKAVGILSNGVDGFTKLRDYKGVGDAAIAAFVATVTTFLRGITQVSTQFSVEGLALAGKFAETAGKVVALLGNGVAGFAALAKFVAPSDASIGVFLNSIATLTATLVNALPRYGADQLTAAGQFADTASKVVGLLASGVAGFAELAKFTTPTSASIGEFIRVLTDITSRFTWYAPIFAAGQLAAAQLFADTASKVVGMIGNGVAGFAALAGFVAPSDAAIAEFVRVLTDITSRLAYYIPQFATGQLAAAGLFAETAGKVAAIIGTGVAGFAALAGFVAPSNQAIAEFVRVLTDITSRVAWYMPTFATGQLAAAQLFAETAGKVTAIIGAGVKGFDALADFRAPTTRTLDEFAWSVGQIVARLVNVAGWFNANGVTAAGAFADSAGKILAIVGSGVQGLTSLFSFVAPGLGALDAFAGAVRGMVARFAWIAGTLSGDGVKAAAEFGAATGTIFGALQSATGFFKSLNGLLLPDRAGIDRLLAPIINTLVAVTSAAQQIGAGGLAAATAFSTAVSAVFGALNAAKPAVAGMVPPGLGGGGGGGGGGAGGITVVFNQNAPIYGVADLQNAIVSGVIEAKRRGRL